MKSDILLVGGGASGLMAAYQAAKALRERGSDGSVTVLEKMPRPARKIMITGKGRCNFTNVKPWNEFSSHVHSKSAFLKPAFHSLPPERVVEFFESFGTPTVVERGDRAFPVSYHASDIVDTLVNACNSVGVKIVTGAEVVSVGPGLCVTLRDGGRWTARCLIVATGGLSYPQTGSTGDGLRWAGSWGHRVAPTFPSLTALVPSGYKLPANFAAPGSPSEDGPVPLNGHVARQTPLSPMGEQLCGVQLKNVGLTLLIDGMEAASEFGDVDFTDGGIEGPAGFQISRKAVKAIVNGSRASLVLDLKSGVELPELSARIKDLWTEIDHDPRSRRMHEKQKCRVLLGKLMPRELIPAFTTLNPKPWVNLPVIAKALKSWTFPLEGFVGYERAVVTAGGVSLDDVLPKTMASRLVDGLYFCGEVLDLDCDTGGYNLQTAFCTGALAGQSAARRLLSVAQSGEND